MNTLIIYLKIMFKGQCDCCLNSSFKRW